MGKTENPAVSIIIPNKNGRNLLKKYLPSVITAARGAEIIVVDDNSDDGSVELLKQAFSVVKITENNLGTGFAGSVNAGAGLASGEILILLNTDVEPEPDFLMPLLRHFDDKNIFAVGCLDKSHEPEGIILRGRGEASWIKGFYVHRRGEVDRTDTAWVSGGSGAFRKSYWKRLGGMDQIYNPFYWEDIDLSYRARKCGFQTKFEHESSVHHYHEQGAIKSSFSPHDVKTIAARNQFLFIWKNLTDRRIFFQHLCWLPVRLIQSVLTGDFTMIHGFLKALLMLPVIMKRRQFQSKIGLQVADSKL